MNVLVTAISGNLGQAICTLINKSFSSFTIIGTDALSPIQGYGLCHKTFKIPFANERNYLESMRKIVDNHKIDLIIPGNELELNRITSDNHLLKITLASPNKTIKVLSDKYKCYKLFKDHDIPFCDTYLPSEYQNQFDKIIVKPRKGSGSKNIHINPKNISEFDNNFIIQNFIQGLELTIPFYIGSNNELLSFLPLIKYGFAPNNAYQTCNKYNNEIRQILLRLKSITTIKGPCNLQCIINDNGIYPFEINCRYSGSVDIQDKLGLNILEIGINEFLLGKPFSGKLYLKEGFAVRQYKSEIFINGKINPKEYEKLE